MSPYDQDIKNFSSLIKGTIPLGKRGILNLEEIFRLEHTADHVIIVENDKKNAFFVADTEEIGKDVLPNDWISSYLKVENLDFIINSGRRIDTVEELTHFVLFK